MFQVILVESGAMKNIGKFIFVLVICMFIPVAVAKEDIPVSITVDVPPVEFLGNKEISLSLKTSAGPGSLSVSVGYALDKRAVECYWGKTEAGGEIVICHGSTWRDAAKESRDKEISRLKILPATSLILIFATLILIFAIKELKNYNREIRIYDGYCKYYASKWRTWGKNSKSVQDSGDGILKYVDEWRMHGDFPAKDNEDMEKARTYLQKKETAKNNRNVFLAAIVSAFASFSSLTISVVVFITQVL